MIFYIKLRKTGEKAFWFLSGKGGLNRLLVHAMQFDSPFKAQRALEQLLKDNPDYEGKVVAV